MTEDRAPGTHTVKGTHEKAIRRRVREGQGVAWHDEDSGIGSEPH